jgi:hypothetical protein
MIVPSKFIPFSQSILGKLHHLNLHLGEIAIGELYDIVHAHFDDVSEFIYALDVLFLLHKIEVDYEKGTVKYVN